MVRRFLAPLVIALGLLIAFGPPRFVQPFRNAFWWLFGGVSHGATSIGLNVHDWLTAVRSIRDLEHDNRSLKTDKMTLEAQVAELKDVAHENETLKKELGFAQTARANYDLIPSNIISKSPSNFVQNLTIGSGSAQGVVVGQPVMSQGYFVGKVTEVRSTTATVELITASHSRIPIVLVQSRATGLLAGGLVGLTGEDFPSDAQIVAGEPVVTSGLGGILPDGLAVGTVQKQLSGAGDFVARATIISPVEFSKLEMVIVLKKK